MSYKIWEAAIAAGASLDEMERLEQGHYSNAFLAKLVAWYNMSEAIHMHSEEAKSDAIKRQAKSKR